MNKDIMRAAGYGLDTQPTSERAYNVARAENLDVVLPAEDELQIDIDSEQQMSIYWEMRPVVNKHYRIIDDHMTPSRSGPPKYHITLRLARKVTVFERIALQLALGSDRVREVLGVVQAMLGDEHPTLFLEKKPESKE